MQPTEYTLNLVDTSHSQRLLAANRLCLILSNHMSHHFGEYWLGLGQGFTHSRDHAFIYNTDDVFNHPAILSEIVILEILVPAALDPMLTSPPGTIRIPANEMYGQLGKYRGCQCRIVARGTGRTGHYWGPRFTGYHTDVSQAGVSSISDAWDHIGSHLDVIYEIILGPPQAPGCLINQVLPQGVIELLQTSPNNETVRSVLLANLKQAVPAELTTFEAIKEWIEKNITPRANHGALPLPPGADITPAMLVPIALSGSDREIGHAIYSVNRRGTGTLPVDADEIIRMARAAGNMDDLLTDIREWLSDDYDAGEYIDMEEIGAYDYSDHEITDREDFAWELDDSLVREQIVNLLRQRDPELLAIFSGERDDDPDEDQNEVEAD